MKKILFLIHIPPPIHGSSVVGQQIKESKVLNEKIEGYYINLLASKKVRASGKFSASKIMGACQTTFKLLKYLITQKPTLCYFALTTTGNAFYRDVLYVFFLKIFQVKIVFHLHNKGISNKQKRYLKLLYSYVFFDTKVILLSERLYYDVEQYVSFENIYICPNGVSSEHLETTRKFKNKSVSLLYLSSLIKSKGIYVLLDALVILDSKGMHFECNIIGGEGDVSEEALKRHIIQLGLEKKVFYNGEKHNEDKDFFFKQSDIFILPTYYSNECFPLVLIEALKFGLPVVSTKEGAIPEIIEDGITGFLTEKKNKQDLADKIEILIKEETLRKEMSKLAQKKFIKNYTLIKFEERLLNIFSKVW